jgi:hypothetical protein
MLSIAALLTAANVAAAQPPEAPGQDKSQQASVGRLIADLDSNEFKVRDDATKALIKLGPPALDALRQALENAPSAEVRLRLKKVVEEIEIWGGDNSELQLSELLDRVSIVAKDDWKKPGYRDQRLEVLLARWLRVLGQAAEKPVPAPPLTFAGLTPSTGDRSARNSLIVVGDADRVSFAQDSIILATGVVDVSSARNCLIVARLGATVSSCHDSVVVAGVSLNASITRNSVLVSGHYLNASITHGAILAAGAPVDCGIPENVTFVNTAPLRDRPERGSRSVRIPRLVLSDPDRKQPLAEALTLTHLGSGLALFRLPDGTGEYVARTGQAIAQPGGREIETLRGWQLRYVSGRVAVFAKGDETSVHTWEK